MKEKMPQIDYLEHMQKLKVEDGDVIVIKIPAKITKAEFGEVRKNAEDAMVNLGVKVKVIVLDGGIEMGVIGGRR